MTVITRGKGRDKVIRALDGFDALDGVAAKWGILENAPDYDDGTSIHMVAAVQIYGIPSSEIPNGQRIPQRDFLGGSFDQNYSEYEVLIDLAIEAVINGQSPESAMEAIAAKGATDTRKDIFRLSFTPNAPSTLAQKSGTQPLVDTRHLLENISYATEN